MKPNRQRIQSKTAGVKFTAEIPITRSLVSFSVLVVLLFSLQLLAQRFPPQQPTVEMQYELPTAAALVSR